MKGFSPIPLSEAVVTDAARKVQKNWKKLSQGKPEFLSQRLPQPLLPVINGTGILLHTNLGRAPLGEAVLQRIFKKLSGYVSLEMNLQTGERGGRTAYLDSLFETMVDAYKPVWV